MRSLVALVLFTPLMLVQVPTAASAASLAGTWSGSGYVAPKEAARERVRCRITYRKETAKVYGVSAKCATTSAKINQTGTILMVGKNRYVGDFYNAAYDVSGRVRVTVSGSKQTVTFSGAKGRGRITLRKR